MADVPSLQSLRLSDVPYVLADNLGNVQGINDAFERVYGWTLADLGGEPLTRILPGAFQMSHQLGFSRFQSTEQSQILGHPLRLKTVCRDGTEVVSDHFIVAEKGPDGWLFGATLTPLEGVVETDA